jgi:hypothetical protein
MCSKKGKQPQRCKQEIEEAMTTLTNNALGQSFTVPKQGWTAINIRVGKTNATAGVASYIEQYIPEFPRLIQVCNVWTDQTFDSLINQSAAISRYAATAITGFRALLDVIKKLDPAQPKVPDAVQQQTIRLLTDLSKATDVLSKAIADVNAQINSFSSVNQSVDARIFRYKDKLEVFWAPLGNIITHIDNATHLVTCIWLTLALDLQQYVRTTPDVNLLFLKKLDIEAALLCWKSLQEEADAFHQISESQKQYWVVGIGAPERERI